MHGSMVPVFPVLLAGLGRFIFSEKLMILFQFRAFVASLSAKLGCFSDFSLVEKLDQGVVFSLLAVLGTCGDIY